MTYKHPKLLRGYIERLRAKNIAYKLVETSGTSTLTFENRKIMFSSGQIIPFKYLHLFKKCKDEVLRNSENLEIPKFSSTDSNYFKFSPNLFEQSGAFFNGQIIELDINKAYYQAARNLGFISPEFYKSCLDLPKQIRLILIGSIATRKQISSFENGGIKRHFTYNSKLRGIWFQIVNEVDNCLNDLAKLQSNSFLFYWVDGIYLIDNLEIQKDLELISRKYNFEFSNTKVESIKILNFGEYNKVILRKEGETKEFTTPKKIKFNPNNL